MNVSRLIRAIVALSFTFVSVSFADVSLVDEGASRTWVLFETQGLLYFASCNAVDDGASRASCNGAAPAVEGCLTRADYVDLLGKIYPSAIAKHDERLDYPEKIVEQKKKIEALKAEQAKIEKIDAVTVTPIEKAYAKVREDLHLPLVIPFEATWEYGEWNQSDDCFQSAGNDKTNDTLVIAKGDPSSHDMETLWNYREWGLGQIALSDDCRWEATKILQGRFHPDPHGYPMVHSVQLMKYDTDDLCARVPTVWKDLEAFQKLGGESVYEKRANELWLVKKRLPQVVTERKALDSSVAMLESIVKGSDFDQIRFDSLLPRIQEPLTSARDSQTKVRFYKGGELFGILGLPFWNGAEALKAKNRCVKR